MSQQKSDSAEASTDNTAPSTLAWQELRLQISELEQELQLKISELERKLIEQELLKDDEDSRFQGRLYEVEQSLRSMRDLLSALLNHSARLADDVNCWLS